MGEIEVHGMHVHVGGILMQEVLGVVVVRGEPSTKPTLNESPPVR